MLKKATEKSKRHRNQGDVENESPQKTSRHEIQGDKKNESPEEVLFKYFTAWQNRDWERMSCFCQKTWIANRVKPKLFLTEYYNHKNLISWQVEKVDSNGVMATIKCIIEYRVNKDVRKRKISANLIREGAPYKLKTDGTWGVNPISTLKEKGI